MGKKADKALARADQRCLEIENYMGEHLRNLYREINQLETKLNKMHEDVNKKIRHSLRVSSDHIRAVELRTAKLSEKVGGTAVNHPGKIVVSPAPVRIQQRSTPWYRRGMFG